MKTWLIVALAYACGMTMNMAVCFYRADAHKIAAVLCFVSLVLSAVIGNQIHTILEGK